jgi:hypothetical protein
MAHYITRNELVDGLIHVHDLDVSTSRGFGLLGLLEIQANAVPRFKDVVRAIQDAVEVYQDDDQVDEDGETIDAELAGLILNREVLRIANSISDESWKDK